MSLFIPHTVIYHANCLDGTIAATIAHYWLSLHHPDLLQKVQFSPARYHEAPPATYCEGHVLIVDFSYPHDVLTSMLATCADNGFKLLILDHHKTAMADLAQIPAEHKVFDMHRSGAGITWDHFFPATPMPLFVQYVQNRDLWLNTLPHIEDFAALMSVRDMSVNDYRLFDDDVFSHELATLGPAHAAHNAHYIKTAMRSSALKLLYLPTMLEENVVELYYLVAVLNDRELISEKGNALLSHYPHVDFALVYSYDETCDRIRYSLRSSNAKADVSRIAVAAGGGGHRNAAGVSMKGWAKFGVDYGRTAAADVIAGLACKQDVQTVDMEGKAVTIPWALLAIAETDKM